VTPSGASCSMGSLGRSRRRSSLGSSKCGPRRRTSIFEASAARLFGRPLVDKLAVCAGLGVPEVRAPSVTIRPARRKPPGPGQSFSRRDCGAVGQPPAGRQNSAACAILARASSDDRGHPGASDHGAGLSHHCALTQNDRSKAAASSRSGTLRAPVARRAIGAATPVEDQEGDAAHARRGAAHERGKARRVTSGARQREREAEGWSQAGHPLGWARRSWSRLRDASGGYDPKRPSGGRAGPGRARASEHRADHRPQRCAQEGQRASATDAHAPSDPEDLPCVALAKRMMGESMKRVRGARQAVETARKIASPDAGRRDAQLDEAHGTLRSRTAVP
jgi:hypothetical protein